MDPDETLREIRRLLPRIADRLDADSEWDAETSELLDHVQALDEWLTRRGFLPKAWGGLAVTQPLVEHISAQGDDLRVGDEYDAPED